MTFPFNKMTMESKNFEKLNLRLNCNKMYQSVKECAEQCYLREMSGIDCVAFLKDKFTGNCKLCNPANQSKIMNSNNTQINEYYVVYILKYKKKKPVMYLPLETDNITGTTVIGEGVNGTFTFPVSTQVLDGKVNQDLHVKHGARMVPDGTANKCIGNLATCTNGLSISLWVNTSSAHGRFMQITSSDNGHSISIGEYHPLEIIIGIFSRSLISSRNLQCQ